MELKKSILPPLYTCNFDTKIIKQSQMRWNRSLDHFVKRHVFIIASTTINRTTKMLITDLDANIHYSGVQLFKSKLNISCEQNSL